MNATGHVAVIAAGGVLNGKSWLSGTTANPGPPSPPVHLHDDHLYNSTRLGTALRSPHWYRRPNTNAACSPVKELRLDPDHCELTRSYSCLQA
jgi:hypothetical protein